MDYKDFLNKNYSKIRNVAINIDKAVSAGSSYLTNFSSAEFEWFCAYLFQLRGFKVVFLATDDHHKADGGIDVVVQKDNKIFIIQCKKQNSFDSEGGKLSVKPVREMAGVVMRENQRYPGAEGIVMTCGDFTRVAFQDAEDLATVSLVDLNDLKKDSHLIDILVNEKVIDNSTFLEKALRSFRYHKYKTLHFLASLPLPNIEIDIGFDKQRKFLRKSLKWFFSGFTFTFISALLISLSLYWYIIPLLQIEIFSKQDFLESSTLNSILGSPEFLALIFVGGISFSYSLKVFKSKSYKKIYKRAVISASMFSAIWTFHYLIQNSYFHLQDFEVVEKFIKTLLG